MSREPPDPLDALLLRPSDAARLLGVSAGTVRNLIARGELRALRVGAVVRPLARDVRRRAAACAGCGK